MSGKLRTTLKNWKPLTLLNSFYKCFPQIVSEPIKSTLSTLINLDQTGFITGRMTHV